MPTTARRALCSVDNLHRQSLEWIRDEHVAEARFSDFATRTFCRACRAPMTMVYEAAPDEAGIVATTMDEAKSSGAIPRVERHVHERDRPSWYTISDSGAQYEGLPGDMKHVKT
ncbi:hypothetical protein J3459_018332 [Metarhizium acridum]|nr:hypothetical protein J3459_018332 [Metarhizium acridum]